MPTIDLPQGDSPTKKQLEYAEILLNDCGMWEVRKKYLELNYGVHHLDELTKPQISRLIDYLKKRKQELKEIDKESRAEEA